ncbi:MAG: DNA-processing protein DprA [Candidatus Babeliales bacterium]
MHHGAIDRRTSILLHLSLIPDFGPAAVLKVLGGLLKAHQNVTDPSLEDIAVVQELHLDDLYTYSVDDCINRLQLTPRLAELLVAGLADRTLINKELSLVEQHGVEVLTFLDGTYPDSLKHIYLPPVVLYCQGAVPDNTKKIALVGARKASGYAQHIVDALVPDLVTHGWQTVSGGANGVDSMVHKRTLDAGGSTIVVLGSGILQPYPEKNIPLFERVIASGSVILSPFPLMTFPDRNTFPARNRIIAGLSQGSVVVQAAARSGALITARFALEQGRTVFAVPGSINDLLSVGCHGLIRQGAILVRSVDDILEEFGDVPLEMHREPVKEKTVKKEPLSRTGQLSIPVAIEQEVPGVQGTVLKSLVTPASLEDVANGTGLSMVELQDIIFELHLDGKVKQHFNGLWQRC